VGSCTYPAAIPQPCFEYGILDEVMIDVNRITAVYASGLNTVRLTNVRVVQNSTLANQPGHTHPSVLHHYDLAIEGVVQDPSIYFKIEECPKNHTTLGPIVGQGLCKHMLDTGDSCCEANRSFSVHLAADCQVGNSSLTNLHVRDMRLDTMTVKPVMTVKTMHVGHVTALIAHKNITEMVMETVKDNIMYYFADANLLNFNGKDISIGQLMDMILRYNTPHQDWHCR